MVLELEIIWPINMKMKIRPRLGDDFSNSRRANDGISQREAFFVVGSSKSVVFTFPIGTNDCPRDEDWWLHDLKDFIIFDENDEPEESFDSVTVTYKYDSH